MDVNTDTPIPATVQGLTDTRSIPLARLAERADEATGNLRHVLPAEQEPD